MAAGILCEVSVENVRSAGSALLVKKCRRSCHPAHCAGGELVSDVLFPCSKAFLSLPKRELLCFHGLVPVRHGLQQCYCLTCVST